MHLQPIRQRGASRNVGGEEVPPDLSQARRTVFVRSCALALDALGDARICCACTAKLTKGRARLVKKPAIQKPGKVEQARLRVEAAIKRLEAALSARDESNDDVAVLNARIQSLLEANATLRQNNHEIGARIDSAIERLRSAIGG